MKSYKQQTLTIVMTALMLDLLTNSVNVFAEKQSKGNEGVSHKVSKTNVDLDMEALDEDFFNYFMGLGDSSQTTEAVDLMDSMVDMDFAPQANVLETMQGATSSEVRYDQ